MTVARRSWSLALAAVAGTIPSAAHAQGFGLNEIGSCAVGRGFTVTARPCADASTLFWNPAAAVRLEGLNLYAGAAAVGIGGDFTEDFTGRQYEPNVPTGLSPDEWDRRFGNVPAKVNQVRNAADKIAFTDAAMAAPDLIEYSLLAALIAGGYRKIFLR